MEVGSFKHLFDACKVSNLAPFSGMAKFSLNKIVTCLEKEGKKMRSRRMIHAW